MEGDERLPQPHCGEYDLLGPDFMQNTRGWYIPILPLVLVTLTPDGPAWRFITNLS